MNLPRSLPRRTVEMSSFVPVMGWFVGLFGSAPDELQKLVTSLDTLRQSPGGCVVWCGLLPMQFSRCEKSGTRAVLPSLVRHNSKFSPISQEEKLKNQKRAASSSIVTRRGVVLQIGMFVSPAGYPAYISVQQHSCNKKAP